LRGTTSKNPCVDKGKVISTATTFALDQGELGIRTRVNVVELLALSTREFGFKLVKRNILIFTITGCTALNNAPQPWR
jgi:hypothetical protein